MARHPSTLLFANEDEKNMVKIGLLSCEGEPTAYHRPPTYLKLLDLLPQAEVGTSELFMMHCARKLALVFETAERSPQYIYTKLLEAQKKYTLHSNGIFEWRCDWEDDASVMFHYICLAIGKIRFLLSKERGEDQVSDQFPEFINKLDSLRWMNNYLRTSLTIAMVELAPHTHLCGSVSMDEDDKKQDILPCIAGDCWMFKLTARIVYAKTHDDVINSVIALAAFTSVLCMLHSCELPPYFITTLDSIHTVNVT